MAHTHAHTRTLSRSDIIATCLSPAPSASIRCSVTHTRIRLEMDEIEIRLISPLGIDNLLSVEFDTAHPSTIGDYSKSNRSLHCRARQPARQSVSCCSPQSLAPAPHHTLRIISFHWHTRADTRIHAHTNTHTHTHSHTHTLTHANTRMPTHTRPVLVLSGC